MESRGCGSWARFFAIVGPFFRAKECRRGRLLLLALLLLYLSISGLNVINSFVGRDFMTAIEQRQASRFVWLALVWAGVFACLTTIEVFARFSEESLGLRWRDWLTRHIVDRYLSCRAYYRIKDRHDLDNPDQRIAEDVKTFTTHTLSFLLIGVNSTITLCSFAAILWSITPWLFVGAVVYAALGSLTTILVGRKLIRFDSLQLAKEADLRYELIHVRTHAEPVALLGGEAHVRGRIGQRLEAVVRNFRQIIRLNRNLAFFTVGYNYMIQLVPVLIVAPLYIQGRIEFGEIPQASMAFCQVMGAFSLIVREFQRIAAFGAVIERVGHAWEVIEQETTPDRKAALEIEMNPDRVAYEGLTLVTPGESRLLIQDLTLELPRGKRLLVTGPSGCGKTSLIRATAGLWMHGQGHIVRPMREDVVFLPQRPHLTVGTLRDQLRYGLRGVEPTDEEIRAVLQNVQLDKLLERAGGLDVEHDWGTLLSPSDQQRVAFARLLLANPPFAFLDEATSTLGSDKAAVLYQLLENTSISYLSTSGDTGLLSYHDLLLKLSGDGGWTLTAPVRAASA